MCIINSNEIGGKMLKYTTAREDVEDITNQILAIQAEDERQKAEELVEESIDIPRKGRGVGKGYEYTLKELAVFVGAENHADPAKRTESIYSEGVKNFIKNQHIMLHFEKAKRIGFTTEEAEDYAALQYCLDIQSGNIKHTIGRMLNG
jgi:plasmid stabilization system protein ParE